MNFAKRKNIISIGSSNNYRIYFYQGKSEPFIMLVLFGLLLIYSIPSQIIQENSFNKFTISLLEILV